MRKRAAKNATRDPGTQLGTDLLVIPGSTRWYCHQPSRDQKPVLPAFKEVWV